MKKFVLLLLTIVMILLCVGCGNRNAPDTGPESKVVLAEVIEIDGDTVLVKPEDGTSELRSSDRYAIPKERIRDDIDLKAGMWLQIFYSGSIEESYPAAFGGLKSISVAEWAGRRDAVDEETITEADEEDPEDIRTISFDANGDVLNGNVYQTDILEIIRTYRP